LTGELENGPLNLLTVSFIFVVLVLPFYFCLLLKVLFYECISSSTRFSLDFSRELHHPFVPCRFAPEVDHTKIVQFLSGYCREPYSRLWRRVGGNARTECVLGIIASQDRGCIFSCVEGQNKGFNLVDGN